MLVYTALGITLLAAFLTLYRLWHTVAGSLRLVWYKILFWLLFGLLTYLYGPWVFLSIYLKYVFGLCVVLVLLSGIIRKKNTYKGKRSPIVYLLLSALVTVCCVLYFTGTTGKSEDVALSFPLRTGNYFVLQGGKGLPSNIFHYSYRGAIYAMDIVKLDKWGNRANGIFSDKLEDYHIFNDTIYNEINIPVAVIEKVECRLFADNVLHIKTIQRGEQGRYCEK